MSLNWKEIDLILKELPLTNSHIQKIRQPDFQTLLLEIYSPGRRFNLLVCLATGKTRLHETLRVPASEISLQRFAQFLRSRIAGGRIVSARQYGAERMVELKIIRGGEETSLWIRLWGGAGNILAVDANGTILDAFYRRPGRGEVSGGVFGLPEPRTAGGTEKAPGDFRSRFSPGEDAGSVNLQADEHYRRLEEQEELEKLVQKVRRIFDVREASLRRASDLGRERETNYSDPESFRQMGDLLMSNLHLLKKGEKWAVLENYYRDGQETRVELDPRLSPEENARNYYKKAAKARSGGRRAEEELANVRGQLEALEKERRELLEHPSLEVLRSYVKKETPAPGVRAKEKPPGLQFSSGGHAILVGRTAKENDELLRKHVRGNDTWLHTRDYPGGYVFIRALPGKSVPLEVLLDGANLALFYSKGRQNGRGELYYTQVKYLRRAKDGPAGLVLPTQEKNLSIVLDQQRLDRLQKQDRLQNP